MSIFLKDLCNEIINKGTLDVVLKHRHLVGRHCTSSLKMFKVLVEKNDCDSQFGFHRGCLVENVRLVNQVLHGLVKNVHTLDYAICELRKLFARVLPGDVVKRHLQLHQYLRAKKNNLSEITVLKKLEKPTKFNVGEVEQLARKLLLLCPVDIYSCILFCMLVSGRRLIEILKVMPIPPIGGDASSVRILRIAKRRGGVGNNIDITIPLLFCSANVFIQNVTRIREHVKSFCGWRAMSNAQLTSKFAKPVSLAVKSVHSKLNIKHSSSHLMRKLYANVSYQLFVDDKSSTSLSEWIHFVLGHQGGLGTTLHYRTITSNE